MQRHQPVLQLAGLLPVALEAGVLEVGAQARRDVGGDRDAAHAAVRHEAEHGAVLARELDELFAAGEPLRGDAADVGGGILDADHVLELGAAGHRRHRDVDDGAHRHVVEEDRQVDRVADRLEVLIEPFLRRLVVVARHVQGGVGTHLLGVAREIDGFGRRVRAGARDHGHALLGDLHAELDDVLVLLVAERGALAGGADRHEPVRALLDLPLDQALERLVVDLAALEGGDQRRE